MRSYYGKPTQRINPIPWPAELPRLAIKDASNAPKEAGSSHLLHPAITAGPFPGVVFCGMASCRGGCGLPGLFLRLYCDPNCGLSKEAARAIGAMQDEKGFYALLKAAGPHVACGPVWQLSPRWEGERVELGEEYQVPPCAEMWWS